MAAAETGAAMASHRVDLIDENNARRILLALNEQIADPRGADADKHLDEVRTADAEKRHTGFAGDRPRHQSLTGARRAHEQTTLGNPAAELGEFLRVL